MKTYLLGGAAVLTLASGSAQAADLMFAPGEGAFNWGSYEEFKAAHQLDGEQITVFGPWLGPDQELFESVLAYFAEATGADVRYTGSDSFEQQIVVDLEAGSAPNVAVFPQPGLASDMAKRGFLAPIGASARRRSRKESSPDSDASSSCRRRMPICRSKATWSA